MSKKTHFPTAAQIKAFERVEKAIAAARRKGLYFYGRQNDLEAYTEAAMEYLEHEAIEGTQRPVEKLMAFNVLADCGADDTWSYATKEDQDKYAPGTEDNT